MPFVVNRVNSQTFPRVPSLAQNPHMSTTMSGAGSMSASLGIGSLQPFIIEDTTTFFVQVDTSNNEIVVEV